MPPTASSTSQGTREAVARVLVRHGAYHDSIELMLAARDAGERPGVLAAAAVMATPLNLGLLAEQGYAADDLADATPNDLVIAIRAQDDAAADAALEAIERALTSRRGGQAERGTREAPKSVRALAREREDVNLALISVPGRHAAYEVASALDAGMHVFCFSDGVGFEAEAVLKRRARERDLLFMGPDCGTAILDGVALGFANRVRRGPVGIVAASGTGAQELSCLLDAAGVGISQLIGTGGRDLSAEVGGIMTGYATELLGADAATEVIVVVSKPPAPAVADEIAAVAQATGKPVVLAFPGAEPGGEGEAVERVGSLEAAAARAAELAGHALPAFDEPLVRSPSRGWIRGLYSGGTLCSEATAIVAAAGEPVAANVAAPGARPLGSADAGGHAFVDFGADEFTEGRAHPMIDPTLRVERLRREAADPEVSVILLDVVLGHGAHRDPAGELAPAIGEALAARADLNVVVALCGTAADPQGLEAQRDALVGAGATVVRSNARAAALALQAAAIGGIDA